MDAKEATSGTSTSACTSACARTCASASSDRRLCDGWICRLGLRQL